VIRHGIEDDFPSPVIINARQCAFDDHPIKTTKYASGLVSVTLDEIIFPMILKMWLRNRKPPCTLVINCSEISLFISLLI